MAARTLTWGLKETGNEPRPAEVSLGVLWRPSMVLAPPDQPPWSRNAGNPCLKFPNSRRQWRQPQGDDSSWRTHRRMRNSEKKSMPNEAKKCWFVKTSENIAKQDAFRFISLRSENLKRVKKGIPKPPPSTGTGVRPASTTKMPQFAGEFGDAYSGAAIITRSSPPSTIIFIYSPVGPLRLPIGQAADANPLPLFVLPPQKHCTIERTILYGRGS
jgi:hypothetical protein